jgi:hypothetical protein
MEGKQIRESIGRWIETEKNERERERVPIAQ